MHELIKEMINATQRILMHYAAHPKETKEFFDKQWNEGKIRRDDYEMLMALFRGFDHANKLDKEIKEKISNE